MKPYFSWNTLCLRLCLALLAGCSDDDEQPDPQLPPLVWPDDVATAIPDEGFRAHCLRFFDEDKDGRLSKDEVLAVTVISYLYRWPQIHTLEGIAYFSNLERLNLGGCTVSALDLRYNSRLEVIYLENLESLTVLRGPVGYALLRIEFLDICNLKELDLSGCGNLRKLHLGVKGTLGTTLTSVVLPDASHLQYLNIAAANQASYDTLLAGASNLVRLYCHFYPGEVLDLSACAKLDELVVQTTSGSTLRKLRLRKDMPLNGGIYICDENGVCSLEIEYVE